MYDQFPILSQIDVSDGCHVTAFLIPLFLPCSGWGFELLLEFSPSFLTFLLCHHATITNLLLRHIEMTTTLLSVLCICTNRGTVSVTVTYISWRPIFLAGPCSGRDIIRRLRRERILWIFRTGFLDSSLELPHSAAGDNEELFTRVEDLIRPDNRIPWLPKDLRSGKHERRVLLHNHGCGSCHVEALHHPAGVDDFQRGREAVLLPLIGCGGRRRALEGSELMDFEQFLEHVFAVLERCRLPITGTKKDWLIDHGFQVLGHRWIQEAHSCSFLDKLFLKIM